MQQLVLGFFLGVYVGTKYDLTGYVSAAEEYASKALQDMEKRKRYRYPNHEGDRAVLEVPPKAAPVPEEATGWWPFGSA